MSSEYVQNRVKPAIIYGLLMFLAPISMISWEIFLGGLMIIGALELGKIIRAMGYNLPRIFLVLPVVMVYIELIFGYGVRDILITVVLMFLPLGFSVWVNDGWRQMPIFVAASVYIAVLPSSMVFIRFEGYKPLAMVLLVVMATDIFAYELGKRLKGKSLLGSHPFKSVSPNKTIGGYLFGTIAGVIVTFTFLGIGWLPLYVGLVLAIMTHLGDALESALKRTSGIKDSGTLFRDHGGVLDRVDGLIIAAPVGLVLLTFFQL